MLTRVPDQPTALDADEAGSDLPEQIRVRQDKRARLLAEGRQPYPVSVPRTHELREVRARWGQLETGEETDDVVGVAGRVVFIRNTGKLCFATLQEGLSHDDSGTRLQVMLSLAEVGAESLAAWKADVDLGDFVFVRGRVISSRRGELSVLATEWQLASKALRPMPNLHTELSDETRVRQRYADLTVREAARDMVRTRAADHQERAGDPAPRGLHRDRDTGAATGARWRQCPAVPHPPERVRHRHDPADRPRAVPQAGGGRRCGPGLRAGPDLPQRGHRFHPQRGIHHARGLPGLG